MEWRAVVGWEGRYEISDTGAVRTKTRAVRVVTPTGQVGMRIIPGNLLKFSYGGRNSAYRRVMLMGPGHRRHAYVHHLVCETWHGPRPAGAMACHRDDTSTNNSPDNLYWGTAVENLNDRLVNELTADAGADVALAGCDW